MTMEITVMHFYAFSRLKDKNAVKTCSNASRSTVSNFYIKDMLVVRTSARRMHRVSRQFSFK